MRLCILLFTLAAGGCVSRPPSIAHVHLGHALTGVHVTPGQARLSTGGGEAGGRHRTRSRRRRRATTELSQLKAEVAAAVKATNSEGRIRARSTRWSWRPTTFRSRRLRPTRRSTCSSPRRSSRATPCAWWSDASSSACWARTSTRAAPWTRRSCWPAKSPRSRRRTSTAKMRTRTARSARSRAEFGMKQLRAQLDGIIARESPPYRTVGSVVPVQSRAAAERRLGVRQARARRQHRRLSVMSAHTSLIHCVVEPAGCRACAIALAQAHSHEGGAVSRTPARRWPPRARRSRLRPPHCERGSRSPMRWSRPIATTRQCTRSRMASRCIRATATCRRSCAPRAAW